MVLGGKDSHLRSYAAMALGQIRDARAVEPLCKALSDEDSTVQSRAAQALGKIGAPAVSPLCEVLAGANWRGRWHAAKALGETGDARAVEALCKALGDIDNGSVRQSAAGALGVIGGARAVEALSRLLWDADPDIQFCAAKALGKTGMPRELAEECQWIIERHSSVNWPD